MTQKRNRENKHRGGPNHRHLGVARIGLVLCGGFLATGILLLLGGVREWQKSSASLNWPATHAVITHEQVTKTFRSPGPAFLAFAVYQREVSVRYTINSRDYTSDFKLPSNESSGPNVNQRDGLMASVRDNNRITLYYNPENPHQVTLHPGSQAIAISEMSFGGAATLVSSMFILALASWLYKAR